MVGMYQLKSPKIILFLAHNTFIIFSIKPLRQILFRNAKRIEYFTCKYENLTGVNFYIFSYDYVDIDIII